MAYVLFIGGRCTLQKLGFSQPETGPFKKNKFKFEGLKKAKKRNTLYILLLRGRRPTLQKNGFSQSETGPQTNRRVN